MISLNAHSNYTKLAGTLTIDELIEFHKINNTGSVALTDTDGMYGLIQFAKKAEENGLKPILGAYITEPDRIENYVVVLAINNKGYSELCKIITSRKLDEKFNIINLFMPPSNNLFYLINSLELIKRIKENGVISDNVFAELIVTEQQKTNTRLLYEYSKKNNINIIASHPVYFKNPGEFELHKVVTSIKKNSTLINLNENELVDKEYFLKNPSELRSIWKNLPEALWNNQYVVANCNVDLEIGKYKFPSYPLPQNDTSFSYLWKVAFKGLEERYYPITDKAIKRLQYELEVIDELGFSDYFLVVWDIVREAHSRGMLTLGRGSAANSLASYCLKFTEIDPIKNNLYFERFLNRGRTSPPDVDLDFSWKERDEIVKYVFEKCGYEKVAMISTTVTFRARSAFRETAKVFGISEEEISKYSRLIPWTSAKNLPDIAEKFPETKSLKFDDEPWESIIKFASKLSGFPRHLSIHPGGIVITQTPITDYVALEYASNKGLGLIITQPDMYPIEEMGLIKIDLLSQRSLGVLRDTLNSLNKNKIIGKNWSKNNIIPILQKNNKES